MPTGLAGLCLIPLGHLLHSRLLRRITVLLAVWINSVADSEILFLAPTKIVTVLGLQDNTNDGSHCTLKEETISC